MEREFEALKFKPEGGPKLSYRVLGEAKRIVLSVFLSLFLVFY